MPGTPFKPKATIKRLLSVLPERAQSVIMNRYGLGTSSERMTLEAIGKMYKITRERVRQIENYGFAMIRKSDIYRKEQAIFEELSKLMESEGSIVNEDEFLKHLSKDAVTQNQIHFLLILSESFKKKKEDADFHHRWYMDPVVSEKVEEAVRNLYTSLEDDQLIPEQDIVAEFLVHLKDVAHKYKDEEIARRWLTLSKRISRNPLGEWGVASSPNVRAKGMRDFAYLAIRRHGSPMHFNEVATSIKKLFNRDAHVATCHNELIKDPRFILVGRGLYALKEWGYSTGVVKDVIRDILKKNGPLTKDEIIEKVLKERYVKQNTILVNLQNNKAFKRQKDGTYALAE